jgi:hypothetical protein
VLSIFFLMHCELLPPACSTPCHVLAEQQSPLFASYVDVKASSALTGGRNFKAASFQNLTQIFELATTHTHLDHPLCTKCLDNVAKELQERAKAAEDLAQAYDDAVRELQVDIRAFFQACCLLWIEMLCLCQEWAQVAARTRCL